MSVKARGYRSPLRQEQAAQTRRRIVRAAAKLFAENGYPQTSVDDIAAAAGVARMTVFSAGSKPELLKSAVDLAIAGDLEPVSIPERSFMREILADPDQRSLLRRYSGFAASVNARVAMLHEAVRSAADTDPALTELAELIREQRHHGAQIVVAALVRAGPLRAGLTRSAAADLLWLYNDSAHWYTLVHRRGWSQARYRRWLATLLIEQLLPPTTR